MTGATREYAEDLLQPEPFNPPQDGDEERGYAEVAVGNEEFMRALVWEAVNTVVRLGGIVAISGERVKTDDPQNPYVTSRLLFKWDSYGGPAKRPEPRVQGNGKPDDNEVPGAADSDG